MLTDSHRTRAFCEKIESKPVNKIKANKSDFKNARLLSYEKKLGSEEKRSCFKKIVFKPEKQTVGRE